MFSKQVARVFGALGAGTLILSSGCGRIDDGAAGQESRVSALLPNLRFALPTVDFMVPGSAVPVVVSLGETLKVPCSTTALRARYRYVNSGQAAAGAHTNESITFGGATYSFAQAPLPVNNGRIAWASFGGLSLVNTPIKVAIVLDAGGAVAELNETDNKWVAKIVRVCP